MVLCVLGVDVVSIVLCERFCVLPAVNISLCERFCMCWVLSGVNIVLC